VPFLQSPFTRMRLHGQQDSGGGSPGAKTHLLFCATYGPRPTHWVGSPAVPFYRALSLRVFKQVLRARGGVEHVHRSAKLLRTSILLEISDQARVAVAGWRICGTRLPSSDFELAVPLVCGTRQQAQRPDREFPARTATVHLHFAWYPLPLPHVL